MPQCTYCNADVSPNAKACPSCGDNLQGMRDAEAEPMWSLVGNFILLIVCGVGAVAGFSSDDVPVFLGVVGVLGVCGSIYRMVSDD